MNCLFIPDPINTKSIVRRWDYEKYQNMYNRSVCEIIPLMSALFGLIAVYLLQLPQLSSRGRLLELERSPN